MDTVGELRRHAANYGYNVTAFEKTVHLLGIMDALSAHPYLRDQFALKGGSALNLFLLDAPRLSVDLDLNFVGAPEREQMIRSRDYVENALEDLVAAQGYTLRFRSRKYEGGKWRLNYESIVGESANIFLDLDYMNRVPLWPPSRRSSTLAGPWGATDVLVQDPHELVAGKLTALVERNHPRDQFDAGSLPQVANLHPLDPDRLRLAFATAAASRKVDFREATPLHPPSPAPQISRELLPLLRADERPAPAALGAYAVDLHNMRYRALSRVLPFTDAEMAFLDRVAEDTTVVPDLLTTDPALQRRIELQPTLAWKLKKLRDSQAAQQSPPPRRGGLSL